MKSNGFSKLIKFLNQLEQKKISYTLAHNRDETVMLNIAVPGERWEVEFFEDGSIEVEKFISNGEILGEEVLNDLLAVYLNSDEPGIELHYNSKLANAT
ncbi:hypothetical protein [Scytonema sp. UIC 10036]|uniref:hypothetical protein n=1 Tax=Scytonema sp. UIC 10036 TaxID=2304196 RepID=UPI001A9BF256|nr:hypothetical protein [Scytonema sp. UIC 10036]